MKTQHYISKNDEVIFQTDKFDKAKIQTLFDKTTSELQPGEEVEYWKATKTHFHPAMLYVINVDGVLKVVTSKGKLKPYHHNENI